MPGWNEILTEIQTPGNDLDSVRRKYLHKLSEKTGRNTVAYYSGWLAKDGGKSATVNDDDKNGFMNAVYGMDRSKGLDLMLHTPGGDPTAAESIVFYLKQLFGNNIRAVVPQLAMSAGTMIAFSCKEIVMGKQSNLGPYDPQWGLLPAQGILDEFEKAKVEIESNPSAAKVWNPILTKYHPTLLSSCENAIALTDTLVREWLSCNMLNGERNKKKKIDEISALFGSHQQTKNHARHIHMDEAQRVGIKIVSMEGDQELQDLILSVHHAYTITFSSSTVVKIIENHQNRAYMKNPS